MKTPPTKRKGEKVVTPRCDTVVLFPEKNPLIPFFGPFFLTCVAACGRVCVRYYLFFSLRWITGWIFDAPLLSHTMRTFGESDLRFPALIGTFFRKLKNVLLKDKDRDPYVRGGKTRFFFLCSLSRLHVIFSQRDEVKHLFLCCISPPPVLKRVKTTSHSTTFFSLFERTREFDKQKK